MRYWLHPEAARDLRDAAEFYRNRADTTLSQSLLAEFEQSVALLLQHPGLGAIWRNGRRRLLMKRFPLLAHLYGGRRTDPDPGSRSSQSETGLLAQSKIEKSQKIRIGGRVKIDGRTSEFVGLQHPQRRRVDVNRDQIAAANIGIAELMDVRQL